ncbi:MAG: LysM peptidoglycan-binding domain-containing protein [Anaerotignum sp.]|jgi:LysM repeat protein|nr:LysM peptidoglycan-binding domain-containing protein [Anaerotignum sp.]MCI8867298.1 LysM peptidoglycan-binding domain-containing protein [Anaerotignum sp.]
MSDDRFDRTNGGANDVNETDKGYYEDLYNDLPKEVVDILVQTHPLMGKGGERNTEMRNGWTEDDMDSRTAGGSSRMGTGMPRTGTGLPRAGAAAPTYRSRRPSREDVEEIREARMQQVGSEINEIRRAPQQEGDPTRYVSRRDRNREPIGEDAYIQESQPLRADEEDYDDGIQYVSVMPARKRSKIVEEVTLQTTAAPQKRRKSRREPMPFEDMGRDSRDNRPRYEDIDFEERAKQEHLDSLYSNDYDDEYVGRGHNKLAILLGVAALLLIIFLIFQTVSLSSKLEEAQNKLTDSEDYKTRYEQVQLEKMQVQEELEQLKNPASANAENGEQGENGNEGSSTPAGTTTSGSYTEYTVKDGETAWALAQRFLGNGMDYQKILDANNMKESDPLRPGTTIRIPKKQ